VKSRKYITTAIDYPNAAPHMGHVLEKVIADAGARWFRLKGMEVRFQIGTDEHGVKVQRTAEAQGLTPSQLVNKNVPLFEDLYRKLNISFDKFVRTTDKKAHWPTVIELWKRLDKAGKLGKRSYKGLYCSGCEKFVTQRDLEGGKCVNHNKEPEEVSEENWFFSLGEDAQNLKNLLTSDWGGERYRIMPDFRENETLSLIGQGLEDVSFSRPRSSLDWGIPVPGDEGQTMYVWCDALANYISGLGFFTAKEEREWWDSAEVIHVIGKDIARFHALIWPAMLKNAGVRIPDKLLIHGFLTSEGEKMSKSIGNVVVPGDVLKKFAQDPDPLRFYLLHEVPLGRDGDFSWERIMSLYDSKLRNDIGNLLNRVVVLINKAGGNLGSIEKNDNIADCWEKFEKSMDNFEFSEALKCPLEIANEANKRINDREVWKMKGDAKIDELSFLAECLRHIALMLLPFAPSASARMFKQLGLEIPEVLEGKTGWGEEKGWKKVGKAEILFMKHET